MSNQQLYYSILLLSIILCITLTNSLQVRIMIPDNIPLTFSQLKDKNNIKLSINSFDRFIYPDNKNVFVIPNLVSARNMIEVVSNTYLFPILMLDQRPGQQRKYSLIHPSTRQIIRTVQQPIVISPLDKINYFDPEGGFSIKSVLFSGYGMMIGFGVLLYFCYQNIMPKLEEAQQAPNS